MFPLGTSMNTLIARAIDTAGGSEASILGFLSIAMRAGTTSVNAELMKVGPLEGIMAFLKLGVTAGILLALPIIIYQVWAFVFPALNREERRFAIPLFLIILTFFILGACFRLLYRYAGGTCNSQHNCFQTCQTDGTCKIT